MKNWFLLFFCFTWFHTTQCSQLSDPTLKQALLENNFHNVVDRVAELLQEHKDIPNFPSFFKKEGFPDFLTQEDIQEAIAKQCHFSLQALAKIVNENPKMLVPLGLEENLLLEGQHHSLFMHAIKSSTDVLIALLAVPSVAKTCEYILSSYSGGNPTLNHDLYRSVNSTAKMEVLLRRNQNFLNSSNLRFFHHELIIQTQKNLENQNRVHRFHIRLQQERPHQRLSSDILKIITSFLR